MKYEEEHRLYSHDYPGDTQLAYVKNDKEVELTISFTSEDPDCGTEDVYYHGYAGETMKEMEEDLLAEITDYLDRHERGEHTTDDGIHDLDDYYDEFTRTALYAFEGALIKELHVYEE